MPLSTDYSPPVGLYNTTLLVCWKRNNQQKMVTLMLERGTEVIQSKASLGAFYCWLVVSEFYRNRTHAWRWVEAKPQ